MTPDEKFLIAVYKKAKEKGNPQIPVNFKKIALEIGQKETAIKNIIKHLAQANFVKKVEEHLIQLTPRGCALVEEILGLN